MRLQTIVKESNKKKYLFDGATFELFEIENEEDYIHYIEEDDEEDLLEEHSNKLNKVVINVSNMCNLQCLYCYAEGGNYGRTDALMSKETFDNIVYDLEQHHIEEIDVFSFFGGEPILNFNLIQYALPILCQNFNIRNFEIVTNGTNLTVEMIQYLKKYNVALSISYDGPEEITDKLRGKGTYKKGER